MSDEQTRIDLELVERVAARDPSAVGELYDRHSRLIYSLLLRILRDRSEAEEILQDVFVSLWTRVHTYNAALGSPAAWLVRIARNRAIDRLRSSAVRLRAVESAGRAPAPASETPEDRLTVTEQQGAVARALDSLPADQRTLIEDAYFLGLTHAELAARHSLPLGTVKTRIRTGLHALRQLLLPVSTPR
jgi:RNA polymerase sigma-70 factor (ECF subfamily)